MSEEEQAPSTPQENAEENKDEEKPKQESEQIININVLPDDFAKYELSFKMIVIGDAGVGKSCLTMKATKNIFEDFYSATVGFEFFTFNVQLNNTYVRLQIWDTCGQEIYRSLISSFYRSSMLAMMVYSIDDMNSFLHIDTWVKEVKSQGHPDVKIFLIGNKADLEEKRKVPTERAKQYAEENKFNFFMETSAKTGYNAKEVFIEAAKILLADHMTYVRNVKDKKKNPLSVSDNPSVPVPLGYNDPRSVNRGKKKSCC